MEIQGTKHTAIRHNKNKHHLILDVETYVKSDFHTKTDEEVLPESVKLWNYQIFHSADLLKDRKVYYETHARTVKLWIYCGEIIPN